jgi:dihydroneopterin aldolase
MDDVRPEVSDLNALTAVEGQRIYVRDLLVACRVGVTARERDAPQRVRINLDVEVVPVRPLEDDVSRVVDYGWLVEKVRHTCDGCADRLLETLAERIAQACFRNPKIVATRIRIDKVDLFPDAAAVGIEIERRRRG